MRRWTRRCGATAGAWSRCWTMCATRPTRRCRRRPRASRTRWLSACRCCWTCCWRPPRPARPAPAPHAQPCACLQEPARAHASPAEGPARCRPGAPLQTHAPHVPAAGLPHAGRPSLVSRAAAQASRPRTSGCAAATRRCWTTRWPGAARTWPTTTAATAPAASCSRCCRRARTRLRPTWRMRFPATTWRPARAAWPLARSTRAARRAAWHRCWPA